MRSSDGSPRDMEYQKMRQKRASEMFLENTWFATSIHTMALQGMIGDSSVFSLMTIARGPFHSWARSYQTSCGVGCRPTQT